MVAREAKGKMRDAWLIQNINGMICLNIAHPDHACCRYTYVHRIQSPCLSS